MIAVRPLKVDGKRIMPGEVVPGFETWSEVVKRAHLNLGWVVEGTPKVEEPRVEQPTCMACGKHFKTATALKVHKTKTHGG